MNALRFLARIVFGGVFIAASLSKIADPALFAQYVDAYRILPAILVNPTALILPWVELLCGAALAVGVLGRGAAMILNILAVGFLAALGHAWWHGLDISCGCFTLGEKGGSLSLSLLRDAGVLALGLFVLSGQFRRPRRGGLLLD